MRSIIIEKVVYNGKNYYYCNDKFKQGINVVLGENQHGKTTFTYLILYALGMNVSAFNEKNDTTIDEIYDDENNYVELAISIEGENYLFKRNIKENLISIVEKESIKILPINRTHGLFNKDSETFSDWILKKLEIDLIKVENIFSSEHYLNFDDLFRYSYYDQKTDKTQMISDFGINGNIIKKSNQMKKFIFETLLSASNHDYYKKQKEIKELEKNLRNKKAELAIKEDIYKNIFNYKLKDEGESIKSIKHQISVLEKQKDEVINQKNSSTIQKVYLEELKNALVSLQKKHLDKSLEEEILMMELKRANKLYKMERKEIESLEVLSTYPQLCHEVNGACPICNSKLSEGKEKYNNENETNYSDFHFIYTKHDYIEILKSKVSSHNTTKSVVKDLKNELDIVRIQLQRENQKINDLTNTIDTLMQEIISPDINETLSSLNREIAILSEDLVQKEIFEKEVSYITTLEKEVADIEDKISSEKKSLSQLEFMKYEELREHIEKFEEILNKYLEDYYTVLGEEYDWRMVLNKDYTPTAGKHIPHSRVTEIKIFFYLTLLKYSIINKKIIYPKLLIIDTVKDHGIDNLRLREILKEIFKFEDLDCQIIMTCGYEEYEELEKVYSELVIERIDESKLLIKK